MTNKRCDQFNKERNKQMNTNYNCADSPSSFGKLSDEDKRVACDWIKNNLLPRKTPLNGRSSYGLKHILERDTGLYVDNGAFKGAMLQCGYQPIDPLAQNWSFRISKRSPAFKLDGR